MDFSNDYYSTLEVAGTATKEEIRAAYRRLAKKFHPDKNPGVPSAEEKFKSINEAHEVLSNDILRRDYDEYRNAQVREDGHDEQENKSSAVAANNKRTYTRKYTVTKEKRVYVKGEVFVKYWAWPEDELSSADQKQWKYTINPYDSQLNLSGTNIYAHDGVPTDYQRSFKESELFRTPLPQPVKCKIVGAEGEEYYLLPLYDIRIKNIRLEGVVKHENQSLGTLVGDLYGYTPHFDSHEVEEEVTECFGATGAVETKVEDGVTYCRKEFYQPDCTRLWGGWNVIRRPSHAVHPVSKRASAATVASTGCAGYWWIPFLIFWIVVFPKFLVAIAAFVLIWLLLTAISSAAKFAGRWLSFLVAAIYVGLVFMAFRPFSQSSGNIKSPGPSYDSLSTSTEKASVQKSDRNGPRRTDDTTIRHYIRWKAYDTITYATTLSVALSDYRSSAAEHKLVQPYSVQNPMASVYVKMLEKNEERMRYLFHSFDSLQQANRLNDHGFADMIVSCVQSIPYYLVLDRSCNDTYDDEFTRMYLANCERDCCIGNEKFGVRSPAEFLGDLKGDCDTRALFLYGILKHYNFNVALITSEYYKHAMIAVNFKDGQTRDGFSMSIGNRNYYLWETTSAGLKAGQIPTYLQDISRWDIALLNENE